VTSVQSFKSVIQTKNHSNKEKFTQVIVFN